MVSNQSYCSQPDYLNACVRVHTNAESLKLLEILFSTENQFRRQRKEPWGARTLDLDLLLYDDLILSTPTLQIPHRRMRDRAFVLVPLGEITPDLVEPVTGCGIKEFVKQVNC